MDESIPTIPASEADRLDRIDKERRMRDSIKPELDRLDKMDAERRALNRMYRAILDNPPPPKPRPWRPEQNIADTLGLFTKSGKGLKDEP